MNVNAHHISTQKTARYFTLGNLTENTKEVWLVIHGYAQLASDFINEFESLSDGSRFIIAPEGLNRFYAKGFGGKPAASWMTSEDRESEIRDYVAYLDALYNSLQLSHHRVVVLGFSQGVATASRFIHQTNNRVDHFVICSGELASELADPLSERLKAILITYVTGNKDPLIRVEKHEQVYEVMRSLNAKIIEFDGGHEISIESIKKGV